MKVFFNRKTFLIAAFSVAAVVTAFFVIRPAPAGGQAFQTYVLTADEWGVAQDAAVAAAGGRVTFSHAKSGIGVATSASSEFLNWAMASGFFKTGGQDMMVEWQPALIEEGAAEMSITPEDEWYFGLQWNYLAVEAEAAWAAGYTGLGGRVAVVDGGIYTGHVDLAGQIDIAASRSFVPGQEFNSDAGTTWHATQVSGIIAAKDNAIGMIGIAPEATIIGVKVLQSGSGEWAWIIQGILYAATPVSEGGGGAHIINLSLGNLYPRGGGNTGVGSLIAALNKAVNYAGQNALVVSAAGNYALDLDHSGNMIMVPAMSGSGIAVSATAPEGFGLGWPNGATNYRLPASYTSYGNSLVFLAAPGGDSDFPNNTYCIPFFTYPCWIYDRVLTTIRGTRDTGQWSFSAGTSFAAPAVCAVAALVVQRYPGISVGKLKTHLARTADDEGKPGHDPYFGFGFVNARRAVTE